MSARPLTQDAGGVQVIVQARKPDFFNYNMSLYEVVTEDGLMRPVMTGAQQCSTLGRSAGVCDRHLSVL